MSSSGPTANQGLANSGLVVFCGIVSNCLAIAAPLSAFSILFAGAAAALFALTFLKKATEWTWIAENLTFLRIVLGSLAAIFALSFFLRVTGNQQESVSLVSQLDGLQRGVDSIDRKIDNVSRETSDNPRKELQNRGVAWTTERFEESVLNGDAESVALFLAGGMRARPELLWRFLIPASGMYGEQSDPFTPEVALLLARTNPFPASACIRRGSGWQSVLDDPDRAGLVRVICSAPEIRAAIQQQVAEADEQARAASDPNDPMTRHIDAICASDPMTERCAATGQSGSYMSGGSAATRPTREAADLHRLLALIEGSASPGSGAGSNSGPAYGPGPG